MLKQIYYTGLLLMLWGCADNHKDKSSSDFFIAATKMNILYEYVANPIQIYLPDHDDSQLFVSVSNGKVYGSGYNYVVIPERARDFFVTVRTLVGQDTVKIGETKFKVLPLRNPEATLDGGLKFEGKKQLLESKGLILFMKGFDWELPYKVSKFDLVIMHEGCIIKRLESNDALLTVEMKAAFKELKFGDKLIFENIKAIHTKEKTVMVVDPETLNKTDTGIRRKPMDINDLKIDIEFKEKEK